MSQYDRTHHAFFEIGNHLDWTEWASDYQGWNVPPAYRTNVSLPGMFASVVDVTKDTREDSYGDGYGSGSEEDAYILFKVEFLDQETRFYRKNGYYDSYGTEKWTGKFEEVQVVKKTIEVYEPVA